MFTLTGFLLLGALVTTIAGMLNKCPWYVPTLLIVPGALAQRVAGMMAEGTRIERVIAFLRSLGLASQRITALPAFRKQMVGQVGVEPTKSPRSERGAFTSLTTARWCRRLESNRYYAVSQTADSANWPTSAMDGRGGIRTLTVPVLSGVPLPVGLHGRWRSVRDSNPQPDGYGVAVFGTAGLPIGLTLRTQNYEIGKSYDSRDRKDRLRSDDSAVSRKVRVIGSVAIVAQLRLA